MTDPSVTSVHLGCPRREDFRRARGLLLDARGEHTLAEDQPEGHESGEAHTMIECVRDCLPASAEFWLMDRESAYPLKIGVNTIGRLPDNDVVIPGAYVSRRHCAILVHAGDGCELYDIASKNGTYINGARLDGPTRLSSGAEIRMCDGNFVFMSRDGAEGQPGHDTTKAE